MLSSGSIEVSPCRALTIRVHRFPAFVTPEHCSWPGFFTRLEELEEVLLESDLVFLTGVAGKDVGFVAKGNRGGLACKERGIGLEWGREGSIGG